MAELRRGDIVVYDPTGTSIKIIALENNQKPTLHNRIKVMSVDGSGPIKEGTVWWTTDTQIRPAI